MQIVEVRVFSNVDKTLHYRVPPDLQIPAVGSLVKVPLMNRWDTGIVLSHTDQVDFDPAKLKNIHSAIFPEPVITRDLLKMVDWIANYYGHSAAQILDAMLPPTLRNPPKAKKIAMLQLTDAGKSLDIDSLPKSAKKQKALLIALRNTAKSVPKLDFLKGQNISTAIAKSLIEKAYLQETFIDSERLGYTDELATMDALKPKAFELSEEQREAVDSIVQAVRMQQFKPTLLHGVTGSGKTEVYVRAIQEILKNPTASALFLVPEVALAPQTVGTLRNRLESEGSKVVVWHSHLSEGERRDSWLKIARGETRIVVGARSAVFTPIQNLKLVVVDEEHEPAYKQDENPRYHGRDIAVYRAKLNNCCCILGSATPSLESLYNVKARKYEVIRLTKRVDDRELPKIHIVDMRLEFRKNKKEEILSQKLKDELQNRLERQEQSILFLNRRGFTKNLICRECGWVAMSPECSIPLTYHQFDHRLRCHISGYEAPAPRQCPECKSKNIHGEGFGTQKVETVVKALLPKARVMRIDTDTMSKKNRLREILADFRKGKIDILVGTQMIAKGLDFPNVTLVSLVNADQSLYMEDFRAAERTFQLLVQVSGRAGRGDRAGEVIIQTSTPHAAPIQFARHSDFDGFLEDEIELRREFNYPPFRHLIRHLIRGPNEDKVRYFAENWRKSLDEKNLDYLDIRGPIPAPIEKINSEYRYQIWYFTNQIIKTIEQLNTLRADFLWEKSITQVLDVDAINLR